MICCSQFDPSRGHNVGAEVSESLRELGKQLRSESGTQACEELKKIFTHHTPLCPVSLGLRRACILFLNWLQGLGQLDASLGLLLIEHVTKIEPRLAHIFFTECLDVVRMFRDLLVMTDQQIETFPRFVTATRNCFSGGSSATDRGVVVMFADRSCIVRATESLCEILSELLNQFGFEFFSPPGVKLGMCLLTLKNCEELSHCADVITCHVPVHVGRENAEIWLQLEIREDNSDPTAADELRIDLSLGMNSSHVERTKSKKGVLDELLVDRSEGGGILNLVSQNGVVGSKLIYWSCKMRMKKIFSLSKEKFSPWEIGICISTLSYEGDITALTFLAETLSSSVAELVVQYLHFPVLVHLLMDDNNRGSSIGQFLTNAVFGNKYPLNELVEANGPEVLVTLITALTTSRPVREEAPQLVRKLTACVGSHCALPTTKKQKSENSNSTFLMENFLHIIQLLEDVDSGHRSQLVDRMLLFIESVPPDVIQIFSLRTAETILKCDDSSVQLWATFAKMVKGDDRVLPLLLSAGIKDSLTNISADLEIIYGSVACGELHVLISALERELEKDRPISCKVALIRAVVVGLETSNWKYENKPEGNLMSVLMSLVQHNTDNSELLRAVVDLLGYIGPILPGGRAISSPIGNLSTKDGFLKFLTFLVSRFLVPELKQTSHGFAVQEVLKVAGNYISAFDKETACILTPYLTSSYRSSGFSDSVSINSLEDLFSHLVAFFVVNEPIKSVLKALRPAVSRDTGLLSWVLPFVVEAVGPNIEELAPTLRSALQSLLTVTSDQLSKRIEITTVFAIIDHLGSLDLENRKKSSGAMGEFVRSLTHPDVASLDVFIAAAVFVEDYARAVWYLEQKTEMQEPDVLRLGEMYGKLGIEAGVAGACCLLPSSARVDEQKLILGGKLQDLIYRIEQRPGQLSDGDKCRLIELLVDSGRYRSAIALGVDDLDCPPANDRIREACWKLNEWSDFQPSSDILSFNSVFRNPNGEAVHACAEQLVRRLSINLGDWQDVARVFLLKQQDKKTSSTWIDMAKQGSEHCRALILEGAASIYGEKRICYLIELLKDMRKRNKVWRVQQLLAYLKPEISDMVAVCEFAKSSWHIGNRLEAVEFLSSRSSDPKAELLALKYSAELELTVPKLVITRYRDLLVKTKKSTDVCFAFAEYLDSASESSSNVWNRQLLVREIAIHFFESIKFECSGRRIIFVLNRLFQLHWELLNSGDPAQAKQAAEIVNVISSSWTAIPAKIWYTALPQLVVRLTTCSELASVCEDIVVSVLSEYPRQATWIVVPSLLNSRVVERRQMGVKILQRIIDKSEYPNMTQLVGVVRVVAEALVSVARHDGHIKTLSETKEGSRLLRNTGCLLVVPTKAQLTAPFGEEVRIAKFIDTVHVYNTKAKPKRIGVIDSSGRQVEFILKLEKKTDLRKDARMMDFVNVINRELACGQMRTYQVLTLSEDTGLIEFIPNLVTIRKIIDESLVRIGKSVSMYLNKDVMNKLGNKTEGFSFFQSVVSTIPPMLADWFGKQFTCPRVWLQARNTFARTQALWCIVGWVAGLGDRHPDNILIDTESGEMVHVDFDCIFSRGMILNIPELVPFRLTKICVSAMGVTGVEGVYRTTCEKTMRLVRDRRKLLLSVLHAFVADPLIDWQGATGASYKKAREVVGNIDKKLRGFVDVGEIRIDPNINEEKLIVFNEASEKNSGLGKDRGAALSVEGQVDELIRAAVCPRNLSRMYLGWMPLF